jgi:asparagine synthase (glutamine-hydrolysing)
MCGIAGVFNPTSPLTAEAKEACRRMSEAMYYRGPDETGFYHDTHAALGHRRLSIIDLTSGQQPMHSAKGPVVLVFNGEIYNFQELRSQFAEEGYPFMTRSDTEVIIAGYEKWGVEVVHKLRGMFAFALFDPARKCLFAARDPIGKKPFYYFAASNGNLYFASDMQGLAASQALEGKLSPEALGLYFNLGYIPAPYTVYAGVQKLRAGEAMIYDPQGIRQWQYWEIDLDHREAGGQSGCVDRLQELLDQAVACRLIAEVPLGALMSGGIDSNLVVSTMAKLSPTPVKTYTAGFDEKAQLSGTRDERSLALAAAQYYGTTHEEIAVDPNVGTLAPILIPYLGEPFADSSIIPTYMVCRAARKRVTVALTGDGGDEPFGGYSARYIPHLMEEKIREAIPAAALHVIAGFFAKWWPTHASLPRWLRLRTIFRNLAKSPIESLYMDQAIWNPDHLPGQAELLRGREMAIQLMADLYHKASGRDELTRILFVDTKLYMAEDVLVKADRMSMANSLELRSPLLDQRIISFAFSLPSLMKINGSQTKFLLKRLAECRVHPDILSQPKTGFSIPIEFYLRNHWKQMFEDHVFGSNAALGSFLNLAYVRTLWHRLLSGENRNVQFLWAVLVFTLWENGFHRKQHFRSC